MIHHESSPVDSFHILRGIFGSHLQVLYNHVTCRLTASVLGLPRYTVIQCQPETIKVRMKFVSYIGKFTQKQRSCTSAKRGKG